MVNVRIAALAGVLIGLVGLVVPAAASASAPQALLATVDMEAVLKAAQIDPRRADSAITPGSGDSVLLVERALDAKGFLATSYVDGHFGTRTIEAYAAYQRSLGYTGIDASGLPGPTSLRLLGEPTYTVTRVVSAGSRVTYHSALMNTRTKAMLVEAERLLGRTLGITQGSYNPGGVPGSAGTHDGGGALDISVSGMTATTRTNVARVLRQVGFAAWIRTPAQGFDYHIHAIALADPDQSSGAQHQSGDYYLGMNGLANRGPDDGPAVTPKRTWEEYQRSL